MCNFFKQKIQSLNKNQRNFFTASLIFIHILVIIYIVISIPYFRKIKTCEIPVKPILVKPITEEEILEQAEAGKVGELSEEEAKEKGTLPSSIFNTEGKILQIRADSILVDGDGANFEDRQSRNLIVLFTNSTSTFEPFQKTQYIGLEGLKHLKPDMVISISGAENIRGKIEFKANTINIITK